MIKDRGNKTIATKVTTVVPEAVSFDGTSDYLSRASDFVGNVDSKTFTFSCWVYRTNTGTLLNMGGTSGNAGFSITTSINSGGYLVFGAKNTGGTIILDGISGGYTLPIDTWCNVVMSCDMANVSNRYLVINDKVITGTSWSTYTNDTIDFTGISSIGVSNSGASGFTKGRLSNLFLDYTYRDLSIEANRRLFITADGKPADGLASLNPILYLPMKDASTAHINAGTGGNMVQNGTLATADRGANQDNCVQSKFDYYTDYMTSNMAMTSSKEFVVSFNFVHLNTNSKDVFNLTTYINDNYVIELKKDFANNYYIRGKNSANVIIFNVTILEATNIFKNNVNYSVQISLDLTNSLSRHIIVNGVNVTSIPTWSTYTNDTINFAGANFKMVGARRSGGAYDASDTFSQGELYFDNNYIDLATSNPFWDSETNKPIPVRKAMANLGSNPLICSPISSDNAGANYGSGGSFTVNGGGLTGSRGASEHISRSIVVDATKYLTGSILCASLVKWTSIDAGVTWTVTYTNNETVTNIGNGTNNGVVAYYFGFSDTINWTLEANKNLVTNQLGYPREPSKVITESGWTPVLGLFFENSANFGLNSYGADYTQTGVIVSGADVKI